jgi:hypothetical protein
VVVEALAAVLAEVTEDREGAADRPWVTDVYLGACHAGTGTREKACAFEKKGAVGVFVTTGTKANLSAFATTTASSTAGGGGCIALTFGGGIGVGMISLE